MTRGLRGSNTLPIVLLLLIMVLVVLAVASWQWEPVAAYLLQDVDRDEVTWHRWSVLVMEPEEACPDCLQAALEDSRLVLAYTNPGYAEEWRSYWPLIRGEPWVHEETVYEGEYYVEYWRGEWQAIMKAVIEDYLSRGYQGVYLDNVDAAITLKEENPSWLDGHDPVEEMINLVCSLSHHAKSLNPGARVYVNIGSATQLLYRQDFTKCIDGLLREELWTTWTGDNATSPQDPEETARALAALEHAARQGKTVLVADPVWDKAEADSFCARAWSHGLTPIPQPAWASGYETPPLPEWCTQHPKSEG